MTSHPGSELKRSRYRLLGLVGQGQFGRVFCAVHRTTGKLVALKELDRRRFPTHKFLRELRFLLSLQHPNIVTCQALEHTATGRYLVMDYCEGGTLRHLMGEDNRLSLSQSLSLIADILAGLGHAHSRGIVHCDIKPENILLNVEPYGWRARISDFGIARLCQEVVDQDLSNTGSPAYMAPERFYGQYSLTSDLYSVGILLFELMAGHRPFSGTPVDLMSAHLNRPVQIPESIPVAWRSIILTALQKLSARRFRSAAEMLAAVRSIAAQEGLELASEAQALNRPLFEFPFSPSFTSLPAPRQEPLSYPLTDIATVHSSQVPTASTALSIDTFTYLYRASGNQLAFQLYEQEILAPRNLSPTYSHPELWHLEPCLFPIRSLMPCPQGCLAITLRSLHLIPIGIESNPNLISETILEFAPKTQVAANSGGDWVATFTAAVDTTTSGKPSSSEIGLLTVYPLSAHPTLALTPHPVEVLIPRGTAELPQLLALDRRHIAILFTLEVGKDPPVSKAKEPIGTLIKIFARRGDVIGSLQLPIRVNQPVLTHTPYQLLAIDPDHPNSLLVIDLKPFRVMRFGVAIQPVWLAATSWGYVLADRIGQIILLQKDGHQVGQLHVHAPITAIRPLEPYGLLIATWDGQRGSLHTIDLRQLDLELLF